MKQKLKNFPILHRFYARSIKLAGLVDDLSYKDVLHKLENYEVVGRCKCTDPSCGTVYMKREQKIKDDIVEILSLGEALIILHFEKDGRLEFEALESLDFPYIKELTDTLENKNIQKLDEQKAEFLVEEFFASFVHNEIPLFVID